MNEQDTVRDLLGHAVDTVEPRVARSSESVFARAAALRRRRRVAVTGAAAVVVAGGVVLGTGVLPGGTGGHKAAAAGGGGAGAGARAAGFAKLLPAGVGTVREVARLPVKGLKHPPVQGKRGDGPYDGVYAVTRDSGGVGYITVRARKSSGTTVALACRAPGRTGVADCATEKVPGVGQLTTWRFPDEDLPQQSNSMTAQLALKGGAVLTVTSWTGAEGGKPYRTMLTYPLTKAQLRQLALNSALLP
ncbi:hypothetical protein [Streptomyces sp. NPDC020597]|uniref:hypothetical protein n=1 Tax=unclassified Streptomyces TaxID=2593676 RepID=UPI0037AEA9FB